MYREMNKYVVLWLERKFIDLTPSGLWGFKLFVLMFSIICILHNSDGKQNAFKTIVSHKNLQSSKIPL